MVIVRENLKYREGQPAYIYIGQLADTPALYIHKEGSSIIEFSGNINRFFSSSKNPFIYFALSVYLSLLFKLSVYSALSLP